MTSEIQKPIGILSDGQLAMMTGEAAAKYKIPVLVLGEKGKPASFVPNIEIVPGDYNNSEDVINFASKVQSINLDTDHINTDGLIELDKKGFPVIPNPKLTKVIQNRIAQKQMLENAGIPLADWAPVESRKELLEAYHHLGGDVFVKKSEGGYDGNGNRHAKSERSLLRTWRDFKGHQLVVEKRINFKKEIATILGEDIYGGRVVFPIVESFHKDGMLDHAFFPSLAGDDAVKQAYEIANGILDHADGPSLIGLEMFIDQNGKVLTNEFAGRTHNTGHWTIEGTTISQFDAMVLIASRQHLVEPELRYEFATVLMQNLNGGDNYKDMSGEDVIEIQRIWAYPHWYHKAPRAQFPPRKRGHITFFGGDRTALLAQAKNTIQSIKFND